MRQTKINKNQTRRRANFKSRWFFIVCFWCFFLAKQQQQQQQQNERNWTELNFYTSPAVKINQTIIQSTISTHPSFSLSVCSRSYCRNTTSNSFYALVCSQSHVLRTYTIKHSCALFVHTWCMGMLMFVRSKIDNFEFLWANKRIPFNVNELLQGQWSMDNNNNHKQCKINVECIFLLLLFFYTFATTTQSQSLSTWRLNSKNEKKTQQPKQY